MMGRAMMGRDPMGRAAMKASYDCVIIGGGPAGATTAALVAQAGHATLLVERSPFPRPHVGESLMPETYWTLQRLGVLPQLRTASYVPKVGVQFVNDTGKESRPFFFEDHDPRESSRTWHVERSCFDNVLFQNAAAKGADCHDATRVDDVLLQAGGPHCVKLRTADGQRRDVSARVVVDATGQQALLAGKLGLRVTDPHLRKAAIWGHFADAPADRIRDGVTTIILHTRDKRAWFWYIPLAGDVVSVGLVSDNDYLLKGRGTPAQVFAEELENCPALAERLSGCSLRGDLRVAREFSYTTTRHAGDGWVLVGDAFGFIDPIYSSGVFLALRSGELAADAICEGLDRNDLSAAQLAKWTEPFKEGTHWIRKLVHAFYTESFSFGRFMAAHPEHEGNLTDLLIGRVFHDRAGRMFDDLDPWLGRSEPVGKC